MSKQPKTLKKKRREEAREIRGYPKPNPNPEETQKLKQKEQTNKMNNKIKGHDQVRLVREDYIRKFQSYRVVTHHNLSVVGLDLHNIDN